MSSPFKRGLMRFYLLHPGAVGIPALQLPISGHSASIKVTGCLPPGLLATLLTYKHSPFQP